MNQDLQFFERDPYKTSDTLYSGPSTINRKRRKSNSMTMSETMLTNEDLAGLGKEPKHAKLAYGAGQPS